MVSARLTFSLYLVSTLGFSIVGFSIVGILKTFEEDLINAFPEIEIIFELLDQQLIYLSESVKNIIVIINDLTNYY